MQAKEQQARSIKILRSVFLVNWSIIYQILFFPNLFLLLCHQIAKASYYTHLLNNHSIEAFQTSIQNVFSRPRSDGKAFVIKVTDIELIRRTGGIVQGMSGSPIIQDGKLVGAVTHVLVNDPTRGYGVLSEMMLEEAGLLPEQKRGNITGYYGAVSENST